MVSWREFAADDPAAQADSDPAGVLDVESRQRADKATGELRWGLELVALRGKDDAEVWNVRIAGEPKGISTGQPVKSRAHSMTCEIHGRHGISFRVDRLELRPGTEDGAGGVMRDG